MVNQSSNKCGSRLIHRTATLSAALVLLASPANAESTETEELKAMLRSMQQVIEQQNARIAALEAKLAPSPQPVIDNEPSAPAAAAAAPVNLVALEQSPPPLVTEHRQAATRSLIKDMDTMLDQQRAAARVNNEPINPELKGFFPIPGTRTIARIGGSARFDMIADSNNAGNDNLFVPSAIPLAGETGDFGGRRMSLHTKGTRISGELRRVTPDDQILRIYSEFDFFDDSKSNAMKFRTRHFYGQVWNLLVGQTFTAFMDVDAWPDVVDYQGPNAMVNRRQPQIRYTQPWIDQSDQRFLTFVSAEQSDLRIDTAAGGQLGPVTAVSQLPDFVVGARYEAAGWHCQLSSLWRQLAVESGDSVEDEALGWGVSASTSFPGFGKDKCFAQATYGEGIARYINDLGSLDLDGVVVGDGLDSVPVFAAMLGYTHRWNDRWRTTLTSGYVHSDTPSQVGPTGLDSTVYASANLMWHPTPSFRTGFEYLYGRKRDLAGQEADAHRLNFVIRYDLIR